MGIEWPEMQKDIKLFIESCDTCQKMRLQREQLSREYATCAVLEPFEETAIDHIGPLPEDARGNKYVFNKVDSFSHLISLDAHQRNSAEETSYSLLSNIGRYGLPRLIRMDQHKAFLSKMVDSLME
jgi:hypothetical protein